MCYHKSLVENVDDLLEHYRASFESITDDLEPIRERFTILLRKDEGLSESETNIINDKLIAYSQKGALPATLTKEELSELKRALKILTSINSDGVERFYENGFDYLPTPIITAGNPEKFQLFNWGFIPSNVGKEEAMSRRQELLNCVSERMYSTNAYAGAALNAQRCLIPVTGFFEWRWLDEDGTVKIPYFVTFRDQKVRSMAGLYSRWKDKETDQYHYTYTVLTTRANAILEYVHNNKQRMPVFIDKANEKDWLNRDLSQDNVLELCRPSQDPSMRAYTISKLLSARNINTNIPEVINPMNYEEAIRHATLFLEQGEKKKALETFKSIIQGSTLKLENLQKVSGQPILAELG